MNHNLLKSLNSFSVRHLAIEKIRVEIDARLQAIGLPPLHGDWKPEWAFAWAEEDNATAEALEARQEIARASTREDRTEEVYRENPDGSPRLTTMRTSERDRMISDMLNILSDRAETLREAGQNAGSYIDRFSLVLGFSRKVVDGLRVLREVQSAFHRLVNLRHPQGTQPTILLECVGPKLVKGCRHCLLGGGIIAHYRHPCNLAEVACSHSGHTCAGADIRKERKNLIGIVGHLVKLR